jgi:hypothetical protein
MVENNVGVLVLVSHDGSLTQAKVIRRRAVSVQEKTRVKEFLSIPCIKGSSATYVVTNTLLWSGWGINPRPACMTNEDNTCGKSVRVHLRGFMSCNGPPGLHERDNNFMCTRGKRGTRKKQSNYESGMANENCKVAEMGSPLCHSDHETLMGNGVPWSNRLATRQPRGQGP